MTDPTFTTRADLLAWVNSSVRGKALAGTSPIVLRIRRVTAAHSHLIEDQAQ